MQELFSRHDVDVWRRHTAVGRVGLVPTMGSLHTGHMRLVEAARADCDTVIASIFVNPLQFGPEEDYDNYPHDYAGDYDQLKAAGVDAVFAPSVEAMYPRGLAAATFVEVPELTDILCGVHRPGHFRGVVSVVARLFNQIRPNAAFFGEKDFQQLAVIRRMADDLAMDIDVRGVAIEREADGVARSSRNAYLTGDQRERALALNRALNEAAVCIADGDRDFAAIERRGHARMTEAGFDVDYFEVRTAELDPPSVNKSNFRVLAAGWLGAARLIDNVAAPGTPVSAC
ncbi:pantoate--beta-alanine ligase [Salinisphaera sp. USBA-960]|uniref:pantoate--beta-alanine ligase n=1 Tax=Salinisphaera orenii TaxID=856731 RepID=UPI000DBE25C5|nr:pantoate--beta-alanine ligase [Salifodinibacter halophilus]NNC25979.1 pantoate--beta-alanine ligase [Salifodinibacter halophilus]